MYYGHEPHKHSPEDVQVITCRCGWVSGEYPKDTIMQTLGFPWYCERCGERTGKFFVFHPNERKDVYGKYI